MWGGRGTVARLRGSAGAREQPVLKIYNETDIAVEIRTDVIVIIIAA